MLSKLLKALSYMKKNENIRPLMAMKYLQKSTSSVHSLL